jgi:hypothetical protein
MEGNPAKFEAIGSRLGFRIAEDSPDKLCLLWQGPRFPAFLCLGIALLLLFVSIQHGFASRAASLWYFPFMNLVLFGIAIYLLAQRRSIVIDGAIRGVTLRKRTFHRTITLTLCFSEIEMIRLSLDQVYSGFAVAGSSATQSFPVPSLRLVTKGNVSVLLDRGGARRLDALGANIARRLGLSLVRDAALGQFLGAVRDSKINA